MGSFRGASLAAILFAVAVVGAVFRLWHGGLLVSQHSGDALHLAAILSRMDAGELPHRDFMTPLGILSFLPAWLLMKAGVGLGAAVAASGPLFSLLVLPLAWWVGVSRFRSLGAAAAVGALAVVFADAMIYGGTGRLVSVSMHYNDWGWALALLVVLMILIEPGRGAGMRDGLALGVALSVLALMKATFFVGLAPAVAVALLLRGAWRSIAWLVVTGILAAAAVTLATATPEFLLLYARDILAVSEGGIRPNPGAPLSQILGGPSHLIANLILLGAIVALRQAGRDRAAVTLLVLAPGFILISYQNWGNEPFWLLPLGIALAVLAAEAGGTNPLGWPHRGVLRALALAAVVLIAPPSFNMAASLPRFAAEDASEFVPVLAGKGREDFLVRKSVAWQTRAERYEPPVLPEHVTVVAEARKYKPMTFGGETYPFCELTDGYIGQLIGITRDLERSGIARGEPVFVADLGSYMWLFGDFRPVPGGAPWYYGGTRVIEGSDWLLVPRCPTSFRSRKSALEAIERAGWSYEPVRKTDFYVLYRRRR
ncbi:MAG: hypothetical protein D6832_01280 [Alphaproteobacteria bacterium]|nr:MAG: hypothetical protein D6832_01280 [Alphaproteobacteria bacterium]